MALALGGDGGLKGQAGRALLRARGYAGGCLLICGWEGDAADDRAPPRRRGAGAAARRGAMPVGARPGRGAGCAARYARPAPARRPARPRRARRDARDGDDLVEPRGAARRRDARARGHAGARRSSSATSPTSTPTGASLYFTALAAQDAADPFGQWRAPKAAATDAIVAAGGTITHHHAVGADHAPWMPAEVGVLGHDVLRVLKERCDPAGVMNPGKLLYREPLGSAPTSTAGPGLLGLAVGLAGDHDRL